MAHKISSFTGKYAFLSNFYPCWVNFEGIEYPSVEHAFQAAKSLDPDVRKSFSYIRSASDAKSEGRRVALRSDWESVKTDIMYQCLKSKFSDDTLRQLLLSTGDALLEEGNQHGDKIWGTVNGIGSNKLGNLIMKVREEIRI